MSQQIRVLQCFNCYIFQVDIVKKSTKWQCRVCNTKQTIRKECFRGSGPQCRAKVQELNMARGTKNTEAVQSCLEMLEDLNNNFENNSTHDQQSELPIENYKESPLPSEKYSSTKRSDGENIRKVSNIYNTVLKKSKWENYV